MKTYTKDRFVAIFNQMGVWEFRNTCTLQVQWWILSDMFGFVMNEKQKLKQIDKAVEEKSLSRSFWAYFASIYPWHCKRIEEITGFKFVAKKVAVPSWKFKQLADKGYSFGLWNRRPSATYIKKIRDDKILSKWDINAIVLPKDSGIDHNTRWYSDHIIESIDMPKAVDCDIKTLRYAVKKGLFGYWAWYLEPVIENKFDELVFTHLQYIKNYDEEKYKALIATRANITQFEKDAMAVAVRIRKNINLKTVKELRSKHI